MFGVGFHNTRTMNVLRQRDGRRCGGRHAYHMTMLKGRFLVKCATLFVWGVYEDCCGINMRRQRDGHGHGRWVSYDVCN